MFALVAASLFSAAFAASAFAIWTTIAPRIGYMRMLLTGETVPVLQPARAARVRFSSRPAGRPAAAARLRAAA
ncbi:hypothetical protein [Sphingomonas sp.]|uniref:hypothetical protein n=1 Tax=Sphingomonas sp. TaxID=28214 RepID=UPI001EB770AA|nr:hypothetical protein [Sphingomonas sp.]MBX3595176.1 hypothetical protein [Sphingomonas sp.]